MAEQMKNDISGFLNYALQDELQHQALHQWNTETMIAVADSLEEEIKSTSDANRRKLLTENCLKIVDNLFKRDVESEKRQDRRKRILGDSHLETQGY